MITKLIKGLAQAFVFIPFFMFVFVVGIFCYCYEYVMEERQ